MGDSYKEILISCRKKGSDYALTVLIIAADVLLFAAALLIHPIFFAVGAAAVFFSSWLISGFRKEYEYLYVNGDFDVDVIRNKQRRKRMGSYALEQLLAAAPYLSDQMSEYRKKKDLRVVDYTSGEENAKVFALVYELDKERQMVLMELDDDVIADLRRRAPRKVAVS